MLGFAVQGIRSGFATFFSTGIDKADLQVLCDCRSILVDHSPMGHSYVGESTYAVTPAPHGVWASKWVMLICDSRLGYASFGLFIPHGMFLPSGSIKKELDALVEDYMKHVSCGAISMTVNRKAIEEMLVRLESVVTLMDPPVSEFFGVERTFAYADFDEENFFDGCYAEEFRWASVVVCGRKLLKPTASVLSFDTLQRPVVYVQKTKSENIMETKIVEPQEEKHEEPQPVKDADDGGKPIRKKVAFIVAAAVLFGCFCFAMLRLLLPTAESEQSIPMSASLTNPLDSSSRMLSYGVSKTTSSNNDNRQPSQSDTMQVSDIPVQKETNLKQETEDDICESNRVEPTKNNDAHRTITTEQELFDSMENLHSLQRLLSDNQIAEESLVRLVRRARRFVLHCDPRYYEHCYQCVKRSGGSHPVEELIHLLERRQEM